jgi:hypothetical protein
MAFLFLMMGVLDHARSRVLARVGATVPVAARRPRLRGGAPALGLAGGAGPPRERAARPRVDPALLSGRPPSPSSTCRGRRSSCWRSSSSTGCWGWLAVVGGLVLVALDLGQPGVLQGPCSTRRPRLAQWARGSPRRCAGRPRRCGRSACAPRCWRDGTRCAASRSKRPSSRSDRTGGDSPPPPRRCASSCSRRCSGSAPGWRFSAR